MPLVLGGMKRLELLRTQPELKDNLWKIVNALQDGLRSKGYNLGTTKSPVTPVYLNGTPYEAGNLIMDIREKYNIFCSMVIYPIVPKNVIQLRIIPTAVHTLETSRHHGEFVVEFLFNIFFDLVNVCTCLGACEMFEVSIFFVSLPVSIIGLNNFVKCSN